MIQTIPFDPWFKDFLGFSNKNLTSQQFHCLIQRSFGDTLDECGQDCPRKITRYSMKGGYKKLSGKKGVSRERVRQLINGSQRKLYTHSFRFGQ